MKLQTMATTAAFSSSTISTSLPPLVQTSKLRNPNSPHHLLIHRPLSISASSDLQQQANSTSTSTSTGVMEHVKVLKNAAKTRRVPAPEVLSALAAIKDKAQSEIDPSSFLETLGGTESPGRTWMLIFTAQGARLEKGSYFPVTAVQRFDAAAKRIENGVYLGPLGCLTFEGRFSWKEKMLTFVFECIRIKLGPFDPLQISLGKMEDREPSNKDPFFIWFYVDEEIAVARGRSGGTAFWCRCQRAT